MDHGRWGEEDVETQHGDTDDWHRCIDLSRVLETGSEIYVRLPEGGSRLDQEVSDKTGDHNIYELEV